jgi:peptidoglycan hydrolase-like protein with peptidoglycan-binding domain
MAIPKKGLSGEPVRRLQTKLGVKADGTFGANTEKALKDWQTKNGLAADGVAGPDTFMAMGLYELVLLKQGTRGDTVKKLQEKLGVGADGRFGASTEKAVREYQQKNKLVPDGLAGPTTLAQMRVFKEITADTVKSSQVPASTVTEPAGATKTAATATAAGTGPRSIWDTVKSAFKQSS